MEYAMVIWFYFAGRSRSPAYAAQTGHLRAGTRCTQCCLSCATGSVALFAPAIGAVRLAVNGEPKPREP
ncbi:hypothetical protein GUJ93_ZPchr0006g42118 [Zizania palustris]|uniref:Uncharacterized protein n=1 Tax=Zizania palustris TaxID=103762 RepID=A0A8J5T0F2_ZIZPA|nr:hypothetical protein GUJ93_ZPchr0006g42118 [Zizania palustris]